ncbi:MAG: Nramp family divalent metal transporter [Verrucomicrobiales bacterium]|nr:Nramp family divalent metal transporter [Verrucomicrobiales bacterium]
MDTENPYVLTKATVEEPPKSFFGKLKFLGPGFILSASIVGSGELIMTTQLGAKAGFVTLWVVLVSCLVKVAVQLEFGKHAINTGETSLAAFNKLPGLKLGRANWSVWLWLSLMVFKFFQVGGIVGGVAIILHMAFPALSIPLWAGISVVVVALLVFRGKYGLIEKLSIVMIGLFTVLTLISLMMLQKTDFALTWEAVSSGLQFKLPSSAVVVAIAAFGLTGVGGDEIMMYNYWLLEKGYASKTGPRDGSEAWVRRAKAWIRIMYMDALLAMVAYTIVTVAFYLLGAAILHGQGLVPESSEIIETLSRMYTDTLGMGAKNVFLVGAFVVLFSTLLSALAGWTRLFADAYTQVSKATFTDVKTRSRLIALLSWAIPFLWLILFLWFNSPAFMVIIGGVATSVILLLVVFAAFHFRFRRLEEDLRPSRFYDMTLFLSAAAIVAVGIYGIVKLF